MSTQEYYVRAAGEVEARGPFTMDQMVSLAEIGQVDAAMLYYDAGQEQWTAINTNPLLMTSLFPEKKKLKIRTPEAPQKFAEKDADDDKAINVEDLLAAAEGKTKETRGKGDMTHVFERVTALACWTLVVMTALSIFALISTRLGPIYALEFDVIFSDPYIIFGLIDVFFLIVLLLKATTIYPLLRFRALVGLGFFSLIAYAENQPQMLISVIAGYTGVYLTTAVMTWGLLLLFGSLGIAGMLGLAYFLVLA